MTDSQNGSLPRTRLRADSSRVETLRSRLSLSKSEFSRAVGLSEGSYAGMLSQSAVTETVALAAEALVRRQAPGSQDELLFLLRLVKGALLATKVDQLKVMSLDGVEYWLVPTRTAK
jgi:hypothetical protein